MVATVNESPVRYVTQENIRSGVDVNDIVTIANRLQVSQKVVADILGISIRGIQQKKHTDTPTKLDKNISERVLRLNEVIAVAHFYFGQDEQVARWFNTPNPGFDMVNPIMLCDTFLGMDRVDNTLQKLIHGMTA